MRRLRMSSIANAVPVKDTDKNGRAIAGFVLADRFSPYDGNGHWRVPTDALREYSDDDEDSSDEEDDDYASAANSSADSEQQFHDSWRPWEVVTPGATSAD